MRIADLITSFVLVVLGGVVLYDALRLGIGWGTDGPRSGFFPFWLAVLLLGVSAAIAVQALIRADRRPFVRRGQFGLVLKVLAPAIGLVVAIQAVGLYVAAAFYLGFYMRWVGRHSWALVLGLAVAIPMITFVVFETWFLVPMPKGPLEDWLGY